jgi:hypothetical protein
MPEPDVVVDAGLYADWIASVLVCPRSLSLAPSMEIAAVYLGREKGYVWVISG